MNKDNKITVCILIVLICVILYRLYTNNVSSEQNNLENTYNNLCVQKNKSFCSMCGYKKNDVGCRTCGHGLGSNYVNREYFIEKNTASTNAKIKFPTQVKIADTQKAQNPLTIDLTDSQLNSEVISSKDIICLKYKNTSNQNVSKCIPASFFDKINEPGQRIIFTNDLNSALNAKADVSALNAKADVSALNAKADVSALNDKADVSALNAKADVSALNVKLDTSTFNTAKSAIDTSLTNIQNDLNNKVSSTQLNTKADNSTVTALQTSLNNKADTSTVTGLNTNITNIDNKVVKLQSGLEIVDS